MAGALAFVSTAVAANIVGIVGGSAEAGLGFVPLFGKVSGGRPAIPGERSGRLWLMDSFGLGFNGFMRSHGAATR